MKIYIPTVGNHIRLTVDWTFKLYNEGRNINLFDALNHERAYSRYPSSKSYSQLVFKLFEIRKNPYGDYYGGDTKQYYANVTLPADTVLKVDRIYIRKSLSDYDSITFIIVDSPEKRLLPLKGKGKSPKIQRRVRFWSKLSCINNSLEGEFIEPIPLGFNKGNE